MVKSRLGNKDIFAATTSDKPKAKAKDAAPLPVGSSVENKLTVILPPEQVDFLDELALTIRKKTGAKIRRTEIIRALVGGLQSSKLDLTDCRAEADLTDAIRKALK